MTLSDNQKGALFMCASMAGFILNDATMKFAGADLGLFQAIFVRGVFATLVMGLFAWSAGALKRLPTGRDRRLVGWRTLAEVSATFCFLTALFQMPLANLTAILQSLPLAVTLAAALFMGDRFGMRRGMAIVVGFIGVLIIIRPSADGFNVYSLLGLCAVAFVTLRELVTRQLSRDVPSLFVAFVTSLGVMSAASICLLISQVWMPLDVATVALLGLASLFLFLGYYCAVAAMRVGDIVVVSPYRYSIMIWAIVLGYFVFNEVPDRWTWIGMAVIIAAGLFTWQRGNRARLPTVKL